MGYTSNKSWFFQRSYSVYSDAGIPRDYGLLGPRGRAVRHSCRPLLPALCTFLGLQIHQNRSYSYTSGLKAGIVCILGGPSAWNWALKRLLFSSALLKSNHRCLKHFPKGSKYSNIRYSSKTIIAIPNPKARNSPKTLQYMSSGLSNHKM